MLGGNVVSSPIDKGRCRGANLSTGKGQTSSIHLAHPMLLRTTDADELSGAAVELEHLAAAGFLLRHPMVRMPVAPLRTEVRLDVVFGLRLTVGELEQIRRGGSLLEWAWSTGAPAEAR